MAAGGNNFTGTVTLTILEASGLKSLTLPGGFNLQNTAMDPYLVVDFDDIFFCTTSHKTRTPCPVWNETFDEDVEDGEILHMTVFHKSTIPPDPFIAHAQVAVADLIQSNEDEFTVSEHASGLQQCCSCIIWRYSHLLFIYSMILNLEERYASECSSEKIMAIVSPPCSFTRVLMTQLA